VAGPASEDDRRQHVARLAASRRRYDLSAAVRAAGPMELRDPATLTRLAGYVRGGSPRPEEVRRAAAEFDEEAPPARRGAAVGTGFPFTRLVAGETGAIQFVALGPDAVSVESLAADELGVPVAVPGGSLSLPWRQVSPVFPADADLCRFWLAGGVSEAGPEDREALMAEAAAAAARAVRRLLDQATEAVRTAAVRTAGAQTDRMLVHRADGWPVLDAAVAGARPVIRPVAEITDFSDRALVAIADEAATHAPLRYEYAAMLAKISSQGMVSVVPRTLFPAGTVLRSYDQPTADLYVRVPPAAARRLTIPIVARRGPERAHWPQVGRAVIDSTPGGSRQLKVQVRGPGQVTFLSATLSDDGSVPDWPDVLRETPRELASDVPADLVLLVELGPTPQGAAARLDLLDALLGGIRRPDVRVAVVGYRDHFVHDTQVKGSTLDSPERARQALRELRHWEARRGDDHAAPLEDALHWAANAQLEWRARARHLLLVCGSRPPHSNVHTGGQAARCPSARDWEKVIARLRNEHSAECLAVVSDEAWRDSPYHPARGFWERLCATRKPLAADDTSADVLARALGLTADGASARLYLARFPDDAEQDESDGNG
jgi:hypothetical protein